MLLHTTILRRMAMVSAVILAALGVSPAARAQGCVLCYTSAAASGPGGMHALQMGMAVLLVPALLLFVGVAVLIAYRARAASAEA
jgi:hypothetical protein